MDDSSLFFIYQERDSEGNTGLHLAASSGHVPSLQVHFRHSDHLIFLDPDPDPDPTQGSEFRSKKLPKSWNSFFLFFFLFDIISVQFSLLHFLNQYFYNIFKSIYLSYPQFFFLYIFISYDWVFFHNNGFFLHFLLMLMFEADFTAKTRFFTIFYYIFKSIVLTIFYP